MGIFDIFKKRNIPKNKKLKSINEKPAKTISYTKPTNSLKNSSAILDASGKEIATNLGDETTELITLLLECSPIKNSDAQLVNEKAIELSNESKFEEALIVYKNALDTFPDEKILLFNTSRILHYLGRYEESMDFVNKALEVQGNYYEALCVKGLFLSLSEIFEDALVCLNNAINLNKTRDLTAFTLKAHILSITGKYKEGITCCKKGLSLNPKHEYLCLVRSSFAFVS